MLRIYQQVMDFVFDQRINVNMKANIYKHTRVKLENMPQCPLLDLFPASSASSGHK